MANTAEFKTYQKQVVANCQALCTRLQQLGYHIVSGGTDNHLVLVDMKPAGIDGARLQSVLDEVSITLNKNSVPGDKSAIIPGGIRIGTPALTTRGFKEADFVQVADFIDRWAGGAGRHLRGSWRAVDNSQHLVACAVP
jgi:glycine hydroxymethyltransferase